MIIGCAGLAGAESCTFGNGARLIVGPETGGREITVIAELTLGIASGLALNRKHSAFQKAYQAMTDACIKACALQSGVIESGAKRRFCGLIERSYIGPDAAVDHARRLSNVTLLSDKNFQTTRM